MKIRVLKFKKVFGIEYKVGREYDVAEDLGKELVAAKNAICLDKPEAKSLKVKLDNKAIEKVEEDKKEEPKEEIEVKEEKKETKKRIFKRKTKK
jgi:hypothetical protein